MSRNLKPGDWDPLWRLKRRSGRRVVPGAIIATLAAAFFLVRFVKDGGILWLPATVLGGIAADNWLRVFRR
jgi:hypothetical protein